jgi:hypothetical protein
VGRLGADDAGDIALAGLDEHPLAEQYLIPPAAELQELDKAFVGDVGDDEPDLIHVADEHDPRPVARESPLAADEAAQLVLGQLAQGFHQLAEHAPDLGLVTGHAVGFRQCFQELFSLIHAVFNPYGMGFSRLRIVSYLSGIVQRPQPGLIAPKNDCESGHKPVEIIDDLRACSQFVET